MLKIPEGLIGILIGQHLEGGGGVDLVSKRIF